MQSSIDSIERFLATHAIDNRVDDTLGFPSNSPDVVVDDLVRDTDSMQGRAVFCIDVTYA